MRGRTIFLAVLAALGLLCGTAVAKKGHHKVTRGSKHADHIKLGKANNRVFAGGGNDTVLGGAGRDRLRGGRGDDVLLGDAGADRLKGGQGDDVLDGGDGNDVINARGDGGDPDEVVCGPGDDTVLLGKNDRIMVEAGASTDDPAGDGSETGDDPATGDDPGDQGDDPGDQGEDSGDQGDDGDTPDLQEPGDDDGCEHVKRPGHGPKACDSHHGGCDDGAQPDDQCVATERACDDPVETEPEPDDPVDEPDAGSEKLY